MWKTGLCFFIRKIIIRPELKVVDVLITKSISRIGIFENPNDITASCKVVEL